MKMKKIKETKQDLLNKINDLQYEIEKKNEQLIEAKVLEPDNMITRIEAREADARQLILHIIQKCEKETGRQLLDLQSGINLSFYVDPDDD